jgi:hypothetical protein
MKSGFVRTSIDLPRDLHRRLHEVAATGRKIDLTNEQIYDLIEFP